MSVGECLHVRADGTIGHAPVDPCTSEALDQRAVDAAQAAWLLDNREGMEVLSRRTGMSLDDVKAEYAKIYLREAVGDPSNKGARLP